MQEPDTHLVSAKLVHSSKAAIEDLRVNGKGSFSSVKKLSFKHKPYPLLWHR